MGQQTSTADRPPVHARRGTSNALAAVAAILTLLGATTAVWWTSLPGHHYRASGAPQAQSLFVDQQLNVFDSTPTLPATQVSTATLTNVGTGGSTDPVSITAIDFVLLPTSNTPNAAPRDTTSPPPATVPLTIFPGENCIGATIAIMHDCMISVRYTNPGQVFNGELVITTGDGSKVRKPVGASPFALSTLLADPYVVDFGTRPVGETSPPQRVTMSASPDGFDFTVLGVSVVDTVPTQGVAGDYHITSDGCTGADLQLPSIGDAVVAGPLPSCQIQVTDTPGAVGSRPAFLSVSFCVPFNNTVRPAAAPPLQDPNVFCPSGDHLSSFHQIVALNGAGQAVTTTTPPPTTTTTPPVKPALTFVPALTALPPLAPAGRTTQVSGTGFPASTAVTFALVPLGTAPTANLNAVASVVHTTTDGSGRFTNQVMLLMPHLPPGNYEILAQAQFGTTPVTASVNFLVVPGSQQPPKFAGRH